MGVRHTVPISTLENYPLLSAYLQQPICYSLRCNALWLLQLLCSVLANELALCSLHSIALPCEDVLAGSLYSAAQICSAEHTWHWCKSWPLQIEGMHMSYAVNEMGVPQVKAMRPVLFFSGFIQVICSYISKDKLCFYVSLFPQSVLLVVRLIIHKQENIED